MASRPAPPCPHELRPGTAICLRCQHAERGAKRSKQRQMLARGGAAALSLAVIVGVGIAAVTALQGRLGETRLNVAEPSADLTASSADSTPSDTVAAPPTIADEASIVAKGIVPRDPTANGTTSTAVAATPLPGAPTTVAPVVPVGRTALRDTMTADRAGDTVRVSFDLLLSRTRRPDKFETIVRSTLPQVYGAAADSALRVLPFGAVERAGDLITSLPERGFNIPLGGGRSIGVWPVIRAGRDGPIVVAYRAIASR